MGIIIRFMTQHFVKTVVKTINTPVLNGSLLDDKTAVIIGGDGGIGSAIAGSFLQNGCNVIVTGRNGEKLSNIANKFEKKALRTFRLDISDVSNFDVKVSEMASIFGTIDILVYSAGIHGHDQFGAVKEDTWDSVMNINLKAMYFMCQSISNYMIKNCIKGHILTVSSASCSKPGWTPYEISKNAVKALSLGFADKLVQHGIIVNSIAPGPVATPMLNRDNNNLSWPGNPTGRMCTAEEIANIATIMVSSMGDMIVGDTYFVSGGSGTICLDK